MNVLVINCGSSSLKYQLINMSNGVAMASGLVERIGEAMGRVKHKKAPGTDQELETSRELPVPDHGVAMQQTVELLTSPEFGVIKNVSEIAAVGHRIVQGADLFTAPVVVDDSVVEGIRTVAPLAPLHNYGHIIGIESARAIFTGTPQVTVFDTAFHQTMPPEAFTYALPYDYYTELKIRRYGFHGTSHKYVAKAAAQFLGKGKDEANLITLHLGNGCSMAAVKNGKCIDTSMGLTPLAGVMMGTRCGDIDPAIIAFLADQKGLTAREIDHIMNKESGLKGICGSGDMRDVHAARAKGDARAQLAFDIFCYRVRHYLGAYYLLLNPVDALVFTAGIGENDTDVRREVCAGLEHMGIAIDVAANAKRAPGIRDLTGAGSKIKILVVPTNEELEIAEQTVEVLQGKGLL